MERYSLFDTTSTPDLLTKQSMIIDSIQNLVRSGNNIKDKHGQHLLSIENVNNMFYLKQAPSAKQKMYVAVRGSEKPYLLKEKDIMKLGRVKYLVKEIGRLKPVHEPTCEEGNSANSIFTQTGDEFEEIKPVNAFCDLK